MEKLSITLTIVLALCSGIVGTLVSPFFQEKLMNEQNRVSQVDEISKNLQKAHMKMSLDAWRLTIASKATKQELNEIHDSWLFSYREVTKWLLLLEEYYPGNSEVSTYRESINNFYKLETKEFGLSDSINRPKGQALISKFEGDYMNLRRHVYKNLAITVL